MSVLHGINTLVMSRWHMLSNYFTTCRMQRFGMNTYLYAPKDDYKHRLDWRELYTEEQAGMLQY